MRSLLNSEFSILNSCLVLLVLFFAVVTAPEDAAGQEAPVVDHSQMHMPGTAAGWQFMQDAIVFAEFNHQGGPRGGDEFVGPNWWMGMASRNTSRGEFTFISMLSLDPATAGKDGYREIFQAGEALDGLPLVDRQHPHDLFMQLAAVWRLPLGSSAGVTLAGAPAGEPALGPVAFMHRASAADNPTAPLSHHTFDSTHVSFGVITAAVDRGPWTLEGSVFNGREPDDNRWNFDFGRLDSYSGRLWFKPTPSWEFQVSSGRLKSPEELEPGDITRSTLSAAWTRKAETNLSAVTLGYGRNDTDHGVRNAAFVEAAIHRGRNGLYSRVEVLQVETQLFETGAIAGESDSGTESPVAAFTVGIVRDVVKIAGLEGGVGVDATLYAPPRALRAAYGDHPASFHIFFRIQPAAGAMGRMWNMRMSRPMQGH